MFELTQPEKNEVSTICDHLKNLSGNRRDGIERRSGNYELLFIKR